MIVAKERQRKFTTPLGGALVWGLVNSVTHGAAGWHFILQIEAHYKPTGIASRVVG
jgi:hypothetical protein